MFSHPELDDRRPKRRRPQDQLLLGLIDAFAPSSQPHAPASQIASKSRASGNVVVERHGCVLPLTTENGTAEGSLGASAGSVMPASHSVAIEKHEAVTRLPRDASINVSFVSGNPLPTQHFSNVKTENREQTGDRRNGQAASARHTQSPEIYATASPQADQGAPAGTEGHRRRLLPQHRRVAGSHHSALRRRPGDAGPLSHDLTRSLPSVSDLLHLAVTQTDFVGDLDPDTLEANCANSIDLAALLWEERHNDTPVPLSLIQWARCALLLEAEAMLRDREAHAEAERLDAITAGDIDHAGNFIPYDTYRSV